MRNQTGWQFKRQLILAIQTIFLLASIFIPSVSLSAKQPDSSANEILDQHKYGKNVPTVSLDAISIDEFLPTTAKGKAEARGLEDFFLQGPLSPATEGQSIVEDKPQVNPKPDKGQSKKYDSGPTVSKSNIETFLSGPLSRPESVEIKLGNFEHPLKRENRGDPKTTFDQSENRYHSDKQVQKDQEDNPSDDTTVGDDTTTETPDQTPQITLDLTGWTIGGQGNGTHDNYQVVYLNGGTGEQAIVIYDLLTGEVKSVTLQTTITTTTMPDLSGLDYQWTFTKEDGTNVELYKTGQNNAVLYYDANGNLIKAVVTTVEEISLDSVIVPKYFTELYGWTDGLNWG